jgi:hypothetical protein
MLYIKKKVDVKQNTNAWGSTDDGSRGEMHARK